ncbi:hypothetical protein J6590_104752 [Homalodisca vitripennis]|nr:hypothetical protein J6590_104752 [Homalodisca vitripennis]
MCVIHATDGRQHMFMSPNQNTDVYLPTVALSTAAPPHPFVIFTEFVTLNVIWSAIKSRQQRRKLRTKYTTLGKRAYNSFYLSFRQNYEVASKPTLMARDISDQYFPDLRSHSDSNKLLKKRLKIKQRNAGEESETAREVLPLDYVRKIAFL